MAIIKMEMTEYNSMVESIKSLELTKSSNLEDIKELKSNIIDQKKEFSDYQTNSGKTVRVITETRNEEILLQIRPRYDWRHQLIHHLNSHFTDHEILDTIQRELFTKTHAIDHPVQTIETFGLDEYIDKIKSDYHEQLDRDTREKLEKLDILNPQLKELHTEVNDLKRTRTSLEKSLETFEEISEKLEYTQDQLDIYDETFRNLKGSGFFGKLKFLNFIDAVKLPEPSVILNYFKQTR